MTKYSEFVKNWAENKGISYGCAVSMPGLKKDYDHFKKTGEFDIVPKPPKEFSIVPKARAKKSKVEKEFEITPIKRVKKAKPKSNVDLKEAKKNKILNEIKKLKEKMANVKIEKAKLDKYSRMINPPREEGMKIMKLISEENNYDGKIGALREELFQMYGRYI
jgi:hypothetical protein